MSVTVVAAFGFIAGGAVIAGSLWGLLALLPVAWVLRMRVAADAEGVTVVNFVRAVQVPWSEVAGFEPGRVFLSRSLDVCKNDGTRVHIWFATMSGGVGDYSPHQIQDFATKLARLRAEALGQLPVQAGAAELEQALHAIEQGDPGPLDDLLATHRIEPSLYTERLDSLAAEGKLDLPALRASRRARARG
jgi:hypothetical protein